MGKQKKNVDESVILLHNSGDVTLIRPEVFSEKVRKVARNCSAEYLLIQTGADVPSYAFIEAEKLPKKFTPFKVRYKLAVITNNIGGASAAELDCTTNIKGGNWITTECNNFPEFIALLYSMSRIYSLSMMMSSKYDNVNDYEISNRKLVIGDMEVYINNQKIISPNLFQSSMGDIIYFLSGAIDYTVDQLLGWSNPPTRLFASPKRIIIYTHDNRWSFISVKWFENVVESLDDTDYMVSALGMFRNDLIFIRNTELVEFNRFNISGGEVRLVVYMSNNDHTFEESLDHPLNVLDIMQHPEVYYIQHAVTRTLISLDDLLIEVATARYFILMERIVLEILGVDKDCEVIMDIYTISKKHASFIMTYYGYEAFENFEDPIADFVQLLAMN